MKPDYKKIYSDIIQKKHPDKFEYCKVLLRKPDLSALDIIELNKRVFGNIDILNTKLNQKHRSYSKAAIYEILEYGKNNQYNNSQLARHFKLSRNTVAKWKKLFMTLIFICVVIF